MNLKEQVRSDPSPDRALEAIFDLTHSERRAYERVVESDNPVTVAEIASKMNCARTSAYRYVDTLEEKNLFRRVSDDYEDTGCSAYVATSPALVADRMDEEVRAIFEQCQQSIEQCRSTLYSSPDTP